MIAFPVAIAIAAAPIPAPAARVAIYDGPGVSASRARLVDAIKRGGEFAIFTIAPAEIRAGELQHYDVVVHPGGTAGTQGKALGEAGRAAERAFITRGGGYVGVCAGAYLATADYDWSLHVLDAVVVDKEHWNRGTGTVALDFTPAGRGLFAPAAIRAPQYYHQGPLLSAAHRKDLPDYEEFAAFAGDVYGNGARKGVMPGTTALCGGRFGSGRVFACSPHPERTTETWGILSAAVRWAASKSPGAEVGVAELPRKR
jgi:GNAT superfamily N-acetyltransferase